MSRCVSGSKRNISIFNVRKKNVNSIQEMLFFVIARPVECMVLTLLWPHSIIPTLIADELQVLQYVRYYDVFEMLNVDKMEPQLLAIHCKICFYFLFLWVLI